MKYLTYTIGLNCFRIAQWLAPFRTGNLRYNAMFLIQQIDGFDIVYDDRYAHYVDYLEDGHGKHHKFIENITFWALVNYLTLLFKEDVDSYFHNKRTLDDEVYEDFISTSPEARMAEMNQSINRYEVTQ